MREIKFLSPSSVSLFFSDRDEFYLRYLCPHRSKRPKQKDFMSVGSAFDAFVKNKIHIDVHGEQATKGGQFEFDTIFESQVEDHNRALAMKLGKDLFEQYVECGAYGALISEILKSEEPPQMEFTVKGLVNGVPLLGKPDLRYITKRGVHIVKDWKVMGSTSQYGASPYPGYQICRDYGSKTNGKAYVAMRRKNDPPDKVYPDYRGENFLDVCVQDIYLEDKCADWADQLAIYAWLLGEPVGSESFIIGMEQIACRPTKKRALPRAKFASHMNRISHEYQQSLMARLKMCWATIESGHIFDNMTREQSDEHMALLDEKAEMPLSLHPALENYL